MAESVTYADLRFVKAPLKKRISSHLGQDPEADDDGELTYENVQVAPISGGASSLASSGPGDKAGLQSSQPTASWSTVTSSAARRFLVCRSAFSKYLLGLLLTCLLLGMAAVSLGVRYLQVSQQLQHMNRVLEATNSSLRQQLHLKITQLGQREQDLQGSRKELAQSLEALQVEQKDCQAVKEQLQACQSHSKATKETLQREEEQRRVLEERLNSMRDTMRPFFTGLTDTCCPMGWTLMERKCFHISPVTRSWEDSRSYCNTLSSSLAIVSDYDYFFASSLSKVLEEVPQPDSYWIDTTSKDQRWSNGKKVHGYNSQNQQCPRIQHKTRFRWITYQECTNSLPCICEREVVKCPDQHLAEYSRQQEPVPLVPNL
ncbi:B-cell differentiation antigen CD72 isoform X2 [Sturnira hondurensis]|uniref:B-cell differentiation antigen CD72 isoform X2 n=1 Tax=Sturnira hondurensis TaxID=192404 RepID=UPI001879D00F|nr:B-cell differentiation antigen CD72 isoform X2 [Sturnira hondurensis]